MSVSYLLQEIGDKFILEDDSGFILLDEFYGAVCYKTLYSPITKQLNPTSVIVKELDFNGNLCW